MTETTNDPGNWGIDGEALVHQTLVAIQLEEPVELAACRKGIDRFIHAHPNDRLDKIKADFLVFLKDSTRILIQVKTSEKKEKKFVRQMRKWKDIFLSLLVKPSDTIESLRARIVTAILEMFERMKRLAYLQVEREKQVDVYLERLKRVAPAELRRQKREHRERMMEERGQRRNRWCYRPQPCFACH